MKIGDVLKKLMKDNHTTYRQLANDLGSASTSTLSKVLRTNNITTQKLLAICDKLGYQVILKPKYGDDKAARTIVLDNGDEGDQL